MCQFVSWMGVAVEKSMIARLRTSEVWSHAGRSSGRWAAGVVAGATLTLLLSAFGTARAQQLEPRAYSPSPVGANFLGLSYFYSSGGAVFDPSLPIMNAHARIYSAVPYYGRTFDLFGRLANVTAATPYAWGNAHGDVQDVSGSIDRSGFADPLFRFAVNLIGGPALAPREFFQRKPETTLGASLTVIAPYGQYDPSKLINIGTHRWAFKPEVGISHPTGNWAFEFYAGVWLFTPNNNFFEGQVRRQDPLTEFQTHFVYDVRPRLWASFDFTYYAGGSTTVNGQPQNERLGNTRGGFTLSVPVTQQQSLKLNWSKGVTTRVGSELETIGVAWQWLWF